MAKVLIAYHSETGNTEKLAKGVEQGVRSVEGITCIVKKIADITLDDLLYADGIIVGSPTYFGIMSTAVKKVFDMSDKVYGKLTGKVGAAFTTASGAGCGHETTNMSINTAMLIAGMVIQGSTTEPCFGPFAVGEPGEEQIKHAQAMGKKTAELTRKLFD